jgi:hypothetical protein
LVLEIISLCLNDCNFLKNGIFLKSNLTQFPIEILRLYFKVFNGLRRNTQRAVFSSYDLILLGKSRYTLLMLLLSVFKLDEAQLQPIELLVFAIFLEEILEPFSEVLIH